MKKSQNSLTFLLPGTPVIPGTPYVGLFWVDPIGQLEHSRKKKLPHGSFVKGNCKTSKIFQGPKQMSNV